MTSGQHVTAGESQNHNALWRERDVETVLVVREGAGGRRGEEETVVGLGYGLAGGDKDSQPRDIKTAVRLAQSL